MKEIQDICNRLTSQQVEVIELSPRPPRIRYVLPWWRIDIRTKSWMFKWNRRFAHRYDDRNGWNEYYCSLVSPSSWENPQPPRFP